MIERFCKELERLSSLIEQSKGSNEHPARNKVSAILDFKATRSEHKARLLESGIAAVRSSAGELSGISHIPSNQPLIAKIQSAVGRIRADNPEESAAVVHEALRLSKDLEDPTPRISSIKTPYVPEAIRPEINADIQELSKCMNAGCYRSATIICGRILETALHRKYYEVTGQDILEKNPGIGLGNLIAKLVEKNVTFDPGLTQQIHLINQVRVFSVHKKQEAFCPSRAQAEAMVLYTLDSIEQLFRKKKGLLHNIRLLLICRL